MQFEGQTKIAFVRFTHTVFPLRGAIAPYLVGESNQISLFLAMTVGNKPRMKNFHSFQVYGVKPSLPRKEAEVNEESILR
tara:strand:- start:185 stop:424 length:240 start_codon:yes stop_codon:yes gene_type:complete